MCMNFVIETSQFINTKQGEIVLIPIKNKTIDFQNIAFATKYDSNLISLGQL